jgi:nucleoside-diphosphate-sugar epimerase
MADRYLVTGGAGFIGSHIAERLLEEGERVRVLDNFSTGHRENLVPLAARFGDRFEVHEGDVAELEDCRRAVRDVRYVVHEAALASVPRSLVDPDSSHRANATGTLHLLLAAREAGVERVVYAGSSSVYGESKKLPKDESIYPQPLSPYALTKLIGEEYLRLFTLHYGLSTVTLRYFNVFGPRQDPDSPYAAVIPIFVSLLAKGARPTVHGDGLQSRDFTYITNVVDANLAACRTPGASGVYNIACGARTTLLELLESIQTILGTSIPPIHTDPRPGDVRHSEADISRARRELGFTPRVSLAEGLAPTVAFFRQRAGR